MTVSEPAGAPKRAYLWTVLSLLVACQTIAYIDRVNLSVAVPVLIRTFHYTPSLVGALSSVFNWVFTVAILFAGPFVDRVGPRVAYGFGASVWSIGTVLSGVSAVFAPFALSRGIVGIGEGPMIPAGQRVIREAFPASERTRAVGAFFAGNKIGLAVGIPLSAVILSAWGLPWVFYITGLLGFVWLALFLGVYRTRALRMAPGERVAWTSLLRYRTTWGMMLANAGYLYMYYVFATWLPGYLVLARHLSILNSGFIGTLPFAVGFVVTIAGGWLGDALLARGVRRTLVRKGITITGLLAATVFTVLAAYAVSTWAAVTLLTLSVAGFSFTTAALQAIPVDIAPPKLVSSLAGLHNFGGNVAASFAPYITGLLLARTGNFLVPLLVTAGVALVLGVLPTIFLIGNVDRELGATA
jgi:MFS transporter, ACS family, D-galactonate transporter